MPKGVYIHKSQPAEERFWRFVNKADDCWTWLGGRTGGRNRYQYGYFGISSRPTVSVYAHRYSYELAHGAISPGTEIDHLCKNPLCVRPDHLEAVTHAINVERGNGISVKNAAKTHCPQGHEYTTENTMRRSDGARVCRQCDRLRHNVLYARRKSLRAQKENPEGITE